MRFHFLAIIGLILLGAASAGAQASSPLPPGLKGYKPHQIIERVLDKKADLGLSIDQVTSITALHERVADEPHRFNRDPTRKSHDVTHEPMITARQAFDSTVAYLTPPQRELLATLFPKRH
ncbi:MAG: hypothetical protein ABJC74_08625 [Gemmatimonadota bacterium]